MVPWRDTISIHPAADLFPLMSDAELRELGEDIKKNGLRNPVAIWIDHDGQRYLADGRNRLDAMAIVGIDVMDGADGYLHYETVEGDPYDYVISANIHRRHLTAEQKRDLIANLLKATPGKSNRQLAKMVGVSHPHFAKVRHELETSGDVETVTTSIDTKGRKQPARKPKSEPATGTTFAEMGKVRKITKIAQARLDGLAGMFGGLVTFFEMTKPGMSSDPGIQKVAAKTLALFVQQMVDSPETRDGIKALRDDLNRLLAMAKAEKQHADTAPETNTVADMPDIPACLDRRPTNTATKTEADKAKAEALH